MKARSLAVALTCLLLSANVVHAASDAAPKPDAAAAATAAATDAAPPAVSLTAKDAPKDVPEAIATGKSVWDDFKGGKLREGVAGVLVLVIFLWRRFGAKFFIGKLSTWQVGLVTVVVGFLGTVPEALTMAAFDWKVFVWSGLLTSAQAMLVWKTVGQKVLPKIFGTSEALSPETPGKAPEPTEE